MTEDPEKSKKEIENILSDLDSILSDLTGPGKQGIPLANTSTPKDDDAADRIEAAAVYNIQLVAREAAAEAEANRHVEAKRMAEEAARAEAKEISEQAARDQTERVAKAQLEAAAKAVAEVKQKAEQAARAQGEAEAKQKDEQAARIQAEARQKVEQAAKAQAEAEAKQKAEQAAQSERKAAELAKQADATGGIELAPRAGVMKEVPKPVEPAKPPVKSGLPPTGDKPLPSAAPAKQPAAGHAFQELPLPEKTPPEQIRRLAYLCAPPQRVVLEKFSKFLSEVSAKVSKKPLYLHTSLMLELAPTMTPQDILERVKASGAAGSFCIQDDVLAAQLGDVEEVFENADMFLRCLPAAESAKRTTAIELAVDLMLLRAG